MFEKGHPKWGGRTKGTGDLKATVREQIAAHAFQMAELTAEEIEKLIPWSCMRLVMTARMKFGDLAGALIAA